MRRVVVTGMGVVSPIGIGIPAFFEGLRTARPGVDAIRSFDASALSSRVAGEVRGLDPGTIALPAPYGPALRRDRKSLFGLVAAREALRQAFGAARPAEVYPSARRSAYLAVGLARFFLEDVVATMSDGRVDARALLAAARAAPRDAHLQVQSDVGVRCVAAEADVNGIVAINVSACAAGTQALGEAFLAIRDGVADVALSGGYDSMVNLLGVGGFCLLEALSQRNDLGPAASRPFDRHRDGFVLGEGSGMVVLEELAAARRRGAPILAEVLGYATTLDAYRVTDPDPRHTHATACLQAALRDAGLPPSAVDHVNAHGTGTRQNDPAETAAIRAAFGPHADRLLVSSTKSQIGHLIGAAGAVEFLAGIFAVQEGIVPATINLTHADPECDLDYVPLTPRCAPVRTFLSNSLGFGGQNAALVAGVLRPTAGEE